MNRFLLILGMDIKRRSRAKMTVVIMLIIPLVMTGLIGLIFAPTEENEDNFPPIKLLVANNDQHILSKLIMGAFSQDQAKKMFQVTEVKEEDGRRSIAAGEASGLLIIPKNFSRKMVDNQPVNWVLIKNPSQQFLPGIIEEYAQTLAVGGSGLAQVFRDEIQIMQTVMDTDIEKLSFDEALPFLEKTKNKMIQIKKVISPLLIEYEESVPDRKGKKAEKRVNFFGLILPGMAIMFLMFIIQSFMKEILSEREDGKLSRMMFSPLRAGELIAARIVSGWIMGIIVFALIILMGTLIFNINWGNYFYFFLLVSVTSLWLASFFALLNSLFKNKDQAGSIAAPIIILFSAVGGSMFSVEIMPSALQLISRATPNFWFITGTHQVMWGEFPVRPILAMSIVGILLAVAAAACLKRKITT